MSQVVLLVVTEVMVHHQVMCLEMMWQLTHIR